MSYSVNTVGADAEHRRQLADAINLLFSGRSNAVGTITVASGTTTTDVANVLAWEGSVPLLIPADATAAALSPYVSARQRGQFTVTHAAPGSDAVFLYALVG